MISHREIYLATEDPESHRDFLDTDLHRIYTAFARLAFFGKTFKDNDQLKTNTALQIEAGKIEFKVI